MALQDEVSVRLEGQILLEVAGQGDERALLAGEQSAVGVRFRRLRGGEVDAVQREPLLQLALLGRRRDRDLRGGVSFSAAAIADVAGDGVSARRGAGGIELRDRAGTADNYPARFVTVGELVIVGVAGVRSDGGALTDGDGGRVRRAGDGGRGIGLLLHREIGGCIRGSAAPIVDGDRDGVSTFFYTAGIPVNLRTAAFNTAAGG